MKTLYLHIGTPKTATTAIQLFCADNETVLNTHGYTFPDFGINYRYTANRRNAHFLIGELHPKTGTVDIEKEDDTVQQCFTKIYRLFEKFDNVILSDEGLWKNGFLYQDRSWKKIQNELQKGIFTVKVIVYLRRQDDLLYSRWSQQLKTAYGLTSPNYVRNWNDTLAHLPSMMFDYYDALKKIEHYVGKDNLVVRRFDKEHFYGNSIYADFLNTVGLEFSPEYNIRQETANVSLTKNNTEIKRILNGLPELNQSCNRIFRDCLAKSSEQAADDRKYSMFSQQEMLDFMSKYESGNNKIAKEYLNLDEDLFQITYKAEEKWTPDNPTMTEDLVRFSGNLAIHLINKTEQLEQELRQLQLQRCPLLRFKQFLKRIVKRMKGIVKHTDRTLTENLKKDCAVS